MQSVETTYDAIILGAGAAGLYCAIEAGRRNRRVLLLDHAEKAGKKILISGGGRCNFTNLNTRPENFLSANPHFAKSALSSFTPADFIALVEQYDIPYHEKTLGQLFCDRSAHDIVTMLEREVALANVKTLLGTKVFSVTRSEQQSTHGSFHVETSSGSFHSTAVVVATGGLSIPKMGATGLGYQIAEHFGISIVPTRAALVPLVFSARDQADWCDLSGLSAEAVATAPSTGKDTRTSGNVRNPTARLRPTFREKILITHRGLSGPAILQASSYWQPGTPIQLDLAPGLNVMEPMLVSHAPVQSAARAQVFAPVRALPHRDLNAAYDLLRTILPARMAERWLNVYPPANWTNAGVAQFEQKLHAWTLTPATTEGYDKAEVTAGGVDTDELDARTLQSKRVPNLYFIGEVVDVTGWLGGYNFQWAWASAAVAGRHL
jgi:predicted Rossmann fold flavoprotein